MSSVDLRCRRREASLATAESDARRGGRATTTSTTSAIAAVTANH